MATRPAAHAGRQALAAAAAAAPLMLLLLLGCTASLAAPAGVVKGNGGDRAANADTTATVSGMTEVAGSNGNNGKGAAGDAGLTTTAIMTLDADVVAQEERFKQELLAEKADPSKAHGNHKLNEAEAVAWSNNATAAAGGRLSRKLKGDGYSANCNADWDWRCSGSSTFLGWKFQGYCDPAYHLNGLSIRWHYCMRSCNPNMCTASYTTGCYDLYDLGDCAWLKGNGYCSDGWLWDGFRIKSIACRKTCGACWTGRH